MEYKQLNGVNVTIWSLNEDRCHLLVPGHKQEIVWANVRIRIKHKENVFWVVIDRKLNFNEYIMPVCKKACTRIPTIARFFSPNFERRRILMKLFIKGLLFINGCFMNAKLSKDFTKKKRCYSFITNELPQFTLCPSHRFSNSCNGAAQS